MRRRVVMKVVREKVKANFMLETWVSDGEWGK